MINRIRWMYVFLMFWTLVLGSRLVYVQILNHERMTERARKQHMSKMTIRLHRASIIDRNGRQLAMNQRVYSLYIHPQQLSKKTRTLQKLSAILGISEQELERSIQWDQTFQWIRRKALDSGQAAAIRNLRLPGVGVIPEDKRFYPHGKLAGSVIGFVGIDNQGLSGMEYAYESVLKGKAYQVPILRDGLKRHFWFDPDIFSLPYPRRKLQLSLDLYAQYLAEKTLERWMKKTRAIRGLIIGMNPKTGEILFHAQFPGYDPNHYRSALKHPIALQVGAAQWRYEPGSTFKPVIAALALEHIPAIRNQRFDGGHGKIKVFHTLIRDHDSFDELSFDEVLVHSSNVGSIRIGLQIPPLFLYRGFVRLGFRSETGLDYPGELPGQIRPYESWAKIDPAYFSIGQGLAVTPLQLLRFYSTIANDGYAVTPRFARSIYQNNGKARLLLKPPEKPILQPRIARQLKDILRKVVREGTGKKAEIPGYDVAGKTGTAEKIGPDGSYLQGRYIASFIGFFPADDPKLLMMVMFDEPMDRYYGGEVAAPAFRELAESLIQLWHLQPSGSNSVPEEPSDIHVLQAQGLQVPSDDSYAIAGEIPRWPDLRGQTPEQVLVWARQHNIRIAFSGEGIRVHSQLPPPGAPLTVQHGLVWLEPPHVQSRQSNGTKHEHSISMQVRTPVRLRMAPSRRTRDEVVGPHSGP